MEFFAWLMDFLLHLDKHMEHMVNAYGVWTYVILFLIIFAETGLVFAPLLPGDSLLFAAGVFAGRGWFNPHILFVALTIAAFLGDTVNYWIGSWLGPKVRWDDKNRIFKKRYLDQTHEYFERYGAATIIIARFVPIVRTFAPFVAGVGAMTYSKFVLYNIIGGVIWVALCVYGGYWLGGYDIIKNNFEKAVLLIIFVSLLPAIIEFLRQRAKTKRAAALASEAIASESLAKDGAVADAGVEK